MSGTTNFSITNTQTSTVDAPLLPIEQDCAETVCCSQTTAYTLGIPTEIEEAYCVAQHPDGTYYLGGSADGNSLIVKMSPDHDILWSRSFNLTNKSEWIVDLIIDAEGNLAGVGNTELIGSLRDQFVFKYDEVNDNMLWSQIGAFNNNPNSNQSSFTGLYESPDQTEYWLFGQVWPNSTGFGCDGGFWKVDKTNGNLNFFEDYNLGSCESFIHFDLAPNGDPLVCGRFNYINGGTNRMRAAVARIAPSGALIWDNTYMEPELTNARMYAIRMTNDGNSITTAGHGDPDGTSATDIVLFLFKTDMNGNFLWSKYFEFDEGNNERITALVQGPNNGYFISGYFTNASQNTIGYVLHTDPLGNLVWAKQLSDAPSSLIRDMIPYNGRLLLTGQMTLSGTNDEDIFTVEMDLDGNVSQSQECQLFIDISVQFFDGGDAQENSGLAPVGATYNLTANATQLQANGLNNNPLCEDACEEICDNLIDDDGDGLIDCYDDYCTCEEVCEDYFYGDCADDCLIATLPTEVVLNPLWDSETNVYNATHPLVGDLDADGIPEVVSFRLYEGGFALDGQTGAVKYLYEVPNINTTATQGVIGNIDGDPEGEVITWLDNTIYAFEHDGTIKWQVNRPFDNSHRYPSLHDLNKDGIPELIYGRYI
ncbi:MAG: hypothetical protein AAFU60_05850, partial [Bacteroidota bacterium]